MAGVEAILALILTLLPVHLEAAATTAVPMVNHTSVTTASTTTAFNVAEGLGGSWSSQYGVGGNLTEEGGNTTYRRRNTIRIPQETTKLKVYQNVIAMVLD